MFWAMRRDQVRCIVVARLGDVNLVARPFHGALGAVVHLGVVGRLQPLAHRRQFGGLAPPQTAVLLAREVNAPDGAVGKAARATRTVSAGISPIRVG